MRRACALSAIRRRGLHLAAFALLCCACCTAALVGIASFSHRGAEWREAGIGVVVMDRVGKTYFTEDWMIPGGRASVQYDYRIHNVDPLRLLIQQEELSLVVRGDRPWADKSEWAIALAERLRSRAAPSMSLRACHSGTAGEDLAILVDGKPIRRVLVSGVSVVTLGALACLMLIRCIWICIGIVLMRKRHRMGLCIICSYPLQYNETCGVCPECGCEWQL